MTFDNKPRMSRRYPPWGTQVVHGPSPINTSIAVTALLIIA